MQNVSSARCSPERGPMMKLRAPLGRLIVLASVMATAPAPTAQQDAKPAAADIPRLTFEKYTLPNGLDVILSDDKRLPMVAVNLWYHVGPANEEAGRTGFAHLFEHMMVQASKHVPSDTYFKTVEGAGGSTVSGTTRVDRTQYVDLMPAE